MKVFTPHPERIKTIIFICYIFITDLENKAAIKKKTIKNEQLKKFEDNPFKQTMPLVYTTKQKYYKLL